ncbi:MAG: hypothetical protein AAGM36_05205 [Cyanobacteria bacterium J06597_1]
MNYPTFLTWGIQTLSRQKLDAASTRAITSFINIFIPTLLVLEYNAGLPTGLAKDRKH